MINVNLEDLLKPFKDASAAWEVDIEHILNQFISEQDIDAELIDFRNVATLLRGSTNVFARRVDYLYDFTMRAILSLNLHSKAKATRRSPTSKDNISAQITDSSELPNMQDYIDGLRGSGQLKLAEDLLLSSAPKSPSEVNYKIIPKQPATVLVTGTTDNMAIHATPLYRAHRNIFPAILLLETWNPDALLYALGGPAGGTLAEEAATLSISLHRSTCLALSGNGPVDGYCDPTPVCAVTPLVISQLQQRVMGTTSTVGTIGAVSAAMPANLRSDGADGHTNVVSMPMDNDDSAGDFADQPYVPVHSDVNAAELQAQPPTAYHCITAASLKLPIDAAYTSLLDSYSKAKNHEKDTDSHDKDRRRLYLNPLALKKKQQDRLHEIGSHTDGFRQYIIKNSYINAYQSVFYQSAQLLKRKLTKFRCKDPETQDQSAYHQYQLVLDEESDNNPSISDDMAPVNALCEPPVSLDAIGEDSAEHGASAPYNRKEAYQTDFESIIQKKMDELRQMAAAYKTPSSTLKWNDQMKKILAEEEVRPQFNIDVLLKKYKKELVGTHTQLSTLCISVNNKYDVVRSFAVMLHMASENLCTLSRADDGDIIIN